MSFFFYICENKKTIIMNKLIKLNENHYVVIDDSNIKENDYYLNTLVNNYFKIERCLDISSYKKDGKVLFYPSKEMSCYKITHSTQYLDGVKHISPLSLSEIIYGYNIEVLAYTDIVNSGFHKTNYSSQAMISYINGFNEHIKRSKDKLFTVDDMRKAITEAWIERGLKTKSNSFLGDYLENYIESVSPKTEWDIFFDATGQINQIKYDKDDDIKPNGVFPCEEDPVIGDY